MLLAELCTRWGRARSSWKPSSSRTQPIVFTITAVRGELHLKEGLAALKEKVASGKVIRPAPTTVDGTKNRRSPLVASPFFVVEMFELKEPQDFRTRDESGKSSVQILVAVEGCAVIEARRR